MGKLLEFATSTEKPLRSRFGRWMLEVSKAVDAIVAGTVNVQSLLLPEQPSPPAAVSNAGVLFTQDVNGIAELFFREDNGTVVQITSNGTTSGFLAQFTWYVNSTTGNDVNDGATPATALQTLPELSRRLLGKYTKSDVTINLTGTFTTPLMLEFAGSPGLTCRVNAETPTTTASGSLTGAYQAYSAAANTDARVTDAVQAWAASVNSRIRFTSGAASGNISWVLSDLGAGVARIGQLVNRTTGNASPNPGIGDTYVVERLNTQVRGYKVRIAGGMKFKAFDLISHCESNDELAQYIVASGQIASTTDQAPQCQLNGCKFENAVITATQRQNITQSHVGFIGTHSVCALSFSHSRWLVNSHSTTQNVALNAGTRADIQVHFVGQGAGLTLFSFSAVQLTIDGNAVAAGLAFYGVGGVVCLEIAPCAEVVPALAGNTLFGSGNTSTQSCRIHNGGAFYWLTTPTITGPATDCLLGGTATTWAAIAGAPQGAMTNANNAASAGALL